MGYVKGQSGNIAGKPVGAKNKAGSNLRETITAFLSDNFKKIEQDFHALPAKDRARLYCDLLQYGLPKLQAMSLDLGFEKLSDQELSDIINQLIKNQHETK